MISSTLLGLSLGLVLGIGLYGGIVPPPGSPADLILQRLPSMTTRRAPVLHYFDIRGRGEAIRIALADAGVRFEDNGVDSKVWAKTELDGLKAKWTNEGRVAFGQLPMLEADGVDIVQSHSIMRYLGRTVGGWYTGSPKELAVIDMAADGTEDIRKQLTAIKYSDDDTETKQSRYKVFFTASEQAPRWFGYFERLLAKSETGFLGATISHADYLLFDLLDTAESLQPQLSTTLFATLPALTAWRQRLLARPGIKSYLSSSGRRAA